MRLSKNRACLIDMGENFPRFPWVEGTVIGKRKDIRHYRVVVWGLGNRPVSQQAHHTLVLWQISDIGGLKTLDFRSWSGMTVGEGLVPAALTTCSATANPRVVLR